MSKLIVEMELHKNCLDCDLHQIVYGDSYADTDVYCFKEKRLVGKRFGPTKDLARPSWCPIKGELPEGHGDLIDRDILLQTFQNADYETYNDYCEAFDTVEAAETVIAAERKDDEQIH